MRNIWLAACFTASVACAQAPRYALDVNGLPPVSVPGSLRAAALSGAQPAGVSPQTLLNELPPLLPVPIPSIPVETNPVPRASRTPAAGRGEGVVSRADDTTLPVPDTAPSGPEWDAFRARAANPYLVTDPEELMSAWRYYQLDKISHPGLSPETQTSNGIIVMIQSLNRAPKGDSMAHPEEMVDLKNRTGEIRLSVRSTGGVTSRQSPYGEPASPRYASGASVTLTGKRDGPWYEAKGAPPHWVCGLWLKFE